MCASDKCNFETCLEGTVFHVKSWLVTTIGSGSLRSRCHFALMQSSESSFPVQAGVHSVRWRPRIQPWGYGRELGKLFYPTLDTRTQVEAVTKTAREKYRACALLTETDCGLYICLLEKLEYDFCKGKTLPDNDYAGISCYE